MASEQEFDDLLRKKLGDVKPPAPSAMDWGMMANAAKSGSYAAARASASLPFWKFMISGAAACGLLWYGYLWLSAGKAGDYAFEIEAPIAAIAVGGDPGPSMPARVAEPTKESPVRSPREVTSIPSQSHGVLKGSFERSGTTKGSSVVLPKASFSGAPSEAITTHEVPLSQERGSDLGSPKMEPLPATDTQSLLGSGLSNSSTVLLDGNVANGMDPDRSLEPAPMDVAVRMDGLLPHGTPLLLSPAAPLPDPPATSAFPRFALSPWVSVARSIHSAAPSQVADQVDGLGGLNEWQGTAGIRIEYAAAPRFALISGLQYASKGRLQGTITTSQDVSTDYMVSGAYIEVPLSVRYEFPQAGKTFHVRAGALLQFNARAGSDKVVMHDQGLKEMSTLALSSSSVGAAIDIGAGIRFRLGRGIDMFIEPSYQYSLSPVVKNAAFDRLPYNPRIHSFGLGTGLTFQIGSR